MVSQNTTKNTPGDKTVVFLLTVLSSSFAYIKHNGDVTTEDHSKEFCD
jgi:hypothetical protein